MLNTNNKKEVISKEDCDNLSKIMTLKYGSNIQQRTFSITNHSDKDFVYVCIALSSANKSFYYPVEGRLSRKEEITDKEAASLMIDYIDMYFEEYLKDDSILLPISWNNYSFEGLDFDLKGQIKNLHAEEMANELLKESST